tara:strand:+ start:189 stop:686 length:498 start_codon:yes stop_codon:yes gene_type:complete
VKLTKNKLRRIIKESLKAEYLDKLILLLWNPDLTIRRDQAQSLMKSLGITEQQILEHVFNDVSFDFYGEDFIYAIFKKPFADSDMTNVDDEDTSEYGNNYKFPIVPHRRGRETLKFAVGIEAAVQKKYFRDMGEEMIIPEYIFYEDFPEYLTDKIAKEPFADKIL